MTGSGGPLREVIRLDGVGLRQLPHERAAQRTRLMYPAGR
jgi:hypothetical protein